MLDLRLPMGLMFSIVGGMLVIYGLATSGSDIYQRSLEINVNLWWGLVLFAFGMAMLGMGYWRAKSEKDQQGGLRS